MNKKLALCVFCGASPKAPPYHLEAGAQLGRILAETGLHMVYGGGGSGLMGAAAEGAIAAGGTVHGIIPQFLTEIESTPDNLTRLEVVDTLHRRTQRMAEESDAFCALPGGIGTLQEILEFMNDHSLQVRDKPLLLVNLDHHWDHLFALLEELTRRGYIRVGWRDIVSVCDSVDEVVPTLRIALAKQTETPNK